MGISYAVVTKVKEYTETKQYGEALDLLEGEDIFQSLNPQFLRCCGEVYLETDHFYESRDALVKAHVMAPESIRIIYDLVHLYLKMGYYTRAKCYYELYEHFAASDDVGRYHLKYMLLKAQRVDAKELLKILEHACEEVYTDEWGFELALLYASLEMQTKVKEECTHLMAAFRSSPYYSLAESLKKGEYDISNSSFSFPLVEVDEDKDTYSEILDIEEEQWKKDFLKIHPPEPVILQMEDDDGDTEEHATDKQKGFHFPFGRKKNKKPPQAVTTESHMDDEATKMSEPEELITDSAGSEQREDSTSDEPKGPDIAEEQQASQAKSGLASGTSDREEHMSHSTVKTEAEAIGNPLSEVQEDDVSTYIESVMKTVADIEASVAEELQHPTSFETDVHKPRTDSVSNSGKDTPRAYQPKLMEVDDSLSPKERLEKLMRLIEADREEEEHKKANPYQEEELDMDDFLMNLVGASTITDAMVKNYREEQKSEHIENDDE